MHAGNSIVFMDFGKSDAQHIVEISKNSPHNAHREISTYLSRMLEDNANRATVKCIFEESQVDALLSVLDRFSDRHDLVKRVQNSVQ